MSNELPTDEEIESVSKTVTEDIHGVTSFTGAYTYSAFIEGAKWMREKALKALAEEKEKNETLRLMFRGCQEEFIACQKLRAEEKERHKWISVKDILPIDCMTVIIPGGLGYYSSIPHKWYTITHTEVAKPVTWEVTHWMPLPEPPKNY